jgi:hypothetical protein
MAELWMKRSPRGLEAADDDGATYLRRVPQNTVVRVEVWKPRNIKHHRKFFALLSVVNDSTGLWSSVDELLVELKFRVGLVDQVALRSTGEIVKVPGSIAFHNMDDAAFDQFFDRCLAVLCEMAGGIDPSTCGRPSSRSWQHEPVHSPARGTARPSRLRGAQPLPGRRGR